MMAADHEAVFSRIYARHEWGEGESLSGPGSGLARTAALRSELAALIAELGVVRQLDAGCGDFNWLRAARLPVAEYVGVDVVPALVAELRARYAAADRTFLVADITRDDLPSADLILCREVLMHFPGADVLAALRNFDRSGARWLLATTFVDRPANEEIELGHWRPLNLEAPPFDLPAPMRALPDIPFVEPERYSDKRLALWRL